MKHNTFFRTIFSRITCFGRSERGVIMPLLALSLVMLTGLVGIAIDVGRTQMAQSRLQFSLDAATLAAGTTVSTDDLISEATKYLNVNFNGYLGATLVPNQYNNVVTVTSMNVSSTAIQMSAQAKVPTTFMQALGISSVTVNANSTIARQIAGLEVTVMIDVSYGDNLSEFTNGLAGFINDLFASAPGVSGNLYVSVVPFNQTVNVGTQNSSWTQSPTSTAYGSSSYATAGWGPNNSWGGCVDARSGNGTDMNGNSAPMAILDNAPSSALFTQNYYPSDYPTTLVKKINIGGTLTGAQTTTQANNDYATYTNWNTLNNQQQVTSPMSNAWQNEFGVNVWYNPTLPAVDQYASPLNNTGLQGPNFMCPSPIVPLTNSLSSALTAINNIQWVQGDWLPDQGLEWAWNTLSPKWQGLWGSQTDSQGNALPHPYNMTGWNKVVVWVEGTSNSVGNQWTSYNIIDNSIRGAYGYLSDNGLGTTNMASADTIVENRVYNSSSNQSVCKYMQQSGILIYTLGYSPDGTASGLPSFMTGCASGANYIYWFGNNDWGAFDTALNSISNSITKLWLSQ
jgi:Flp pilus assembly protein TadG